GPALNKERVRRAIESRLNQFRAQHRDVDDATSVTNGVHLGYFAQQLLNSYVHAIAWFVGPEETKALADLCLSEPCRREAQGWAKDGSTEITFFYHTGRDGSTDFSVGGFNTLSWQKLKRKVVQYPKGTTFVWNPQNDGGEEDARLFDELSKEL